MIVKARTEVAQLIERLKERQASLQVRLAETLAPLKNELGDAQRMRQFEELVGRVADPAIAEVTPLDDSELIAMTHELDVLEMTLALKRSLREVNEAVEQWDGTEVHLDDVKYFQSVCDLHDALYDYATTASIPDILNELPTLRLRKVKEEFLEHLDVRMAGSYTIERGRPGDDYIKLVLSPELPELCECYVLAQQSPYLVRANLSLGERKHEEDSPHPLADGEIELIEDESEEAGEPVGRISAESSLLADNAPLSSGSEILRNFALMVRDDILQGFIVAVISEQCPVKTETPDPNELLVRFERDEYGCMAGDDLVRIMDVVLGLLPTQITTIWERAPSNIGSFLFPLVKYVEHATRKQKPLPDMIKTHNLKKLLFDALAPLYLKDPTASAEVYNSTRFRRMLRRFGIVVSARSSMLSHVKSYLTEKHICCISSFGIGSLLDQGVLASEQSWQECADASYLKPSDECTKRFVKLTGITIPDSELHECSISQSVLTLALSFHNLFAEIVNIKELSDYYFDTIAVAVKAFTSLRRQQVCPASISDLYFLLVVLIRQRVRLHEKRERVTLMIGEHFKYAWESVKRQLIKQVGAITVSNMLRGLLSQAGWFELELKLGERAKTFAIMREKDFAGLPAVLAETMEQQIRHKVADETNNTLIYCLKVLNTASEQKLEEAKSSSKGVGQYFVESFRQTISDTSVALGRSGHMIKKLVMAGSEGALDTVSPELFTEVANWLQTEGSVRKAVSQLINFVNSANDPTPLLTLLANAPNSTKKQVVDTFLQYHSTK